MHALNILIQLFRSHAGLTNELCDDEKGSAWAKHVLSAACHMHAIYIVDSQFLTGTCDDESGSDDLADEFLHQTEGGAS